MQKNKITLEEAKNSVLNDYRIIVESREASLLGRKEVLTGKAKFGIFGAWLGGSGADSSRSVPETAAGRRTQVC